MCNHPFTPSAIKKRKLLTVWSGIGIILGTGDIQERSKTQSYPQGAQGENMKSFKLVMGNELCRIKKKKNGGLNNLNSFPSKRSIKPQNEQWRWQNTRRTSKGKTTRACSETTLSPEGPGSPQKWGQEGQNSQSLAWRWDSWTPTNPSGHLC